MHVQLSVAVLVEHKQKSCNLYTLYRAYIILLNYFTRFMGYRVPYIVANCVIIYLNGCANINTCVHSQDDIVQT